MSRVNFYDQFHNHPEYEVFAPGRVNLIGEHIDYCGGLVMPMAINQGTRLWLCRIDQPELQIFSERFDELTIVDLSTTQTSEHWSDFVVGVMAKLRTDYNLRGMQIYVGADIGGGGLSSSASFSLAVAHGLLWGSGQTITDDAGRLELARMCQEVEHEYVGVQCGIMDQASIALGGILSLDCASLSFQRVANVSGEFRIVVMNTCHPRDLAGSKYNERVAEIETIKRAITPYKKLHNLCDLTSDDLPKANVYLQSTTLIRRLRHIVTENERVIAAQLAFEDDDFPGFGELMNLSHDSLHADYEVTGDALSSIVEISRNHPACLGARMTGAGFGGCAIALVKADQLEAHKSVVEKEFLRRTGVKPEVYAVESADAAG